MEFIFGLLVGMVLTLVVVGIGVWVVLRHSVNAPLPEMSTFGGEPAVMVMMLEPFLNHQLREALAAETNSLPRQVTQPTQAASRFKLKLNDATLDVQTGRHAKFTAQLTVTAWNFNLQVRPIADMLFGLQDGRVKIAVTNVRVAGFNVPRTLIDHFVSDVVATAETKLNHSLTQLQQDTRVQLSEIDTTEDLLILKFKEPQ